MEQWERDPGTGGGASKGLAAQFRSDGESLLALAVIRGHLDVWEREGTWFVLSWGTCPAGLSNRFDAVLAGVPQSTYSLVRKGEATFWGPLCRNH